MSEAVPTPGSDAAIERGCLCPVLDNHHGEGVLWGGKPSFWVNANCPLHGGHPETDDERKAQECDPS